MTPTQAQETKLNDPLMHDFEMPLQSHFLPARISSEDHHELHGNPARS